MPQVIQDKVRFIMPTSREYQFPAMAIIQAYVNRYKSRDLLVRSSAGEMSLELRYELVMNQKDWKLFRDVGTVLEQFPEPLGDDVDMEVDLREAKILAFNDGTRHVCQALSILTGWAGPLLVDLRRVQPRRDNKRWLLFAPFIAKQLSWDGYDTSYYTSSGDELLGIKDGEWTGVIGYQGWETYLAACLGIGVIEILNNKANYHWCSKHTNAGYRQVIENGVIPLKEQIAEAIRSVERMLTCSDSSIQAPIKEGNPIGGMGSLKSTAMSVDAS